jgi:hypothetical protein
LKAFEKSKEMMVKLGERNKGEVRMCSIGVRVRSEEDCAKEVEIVVQIISVQGGGLKIGMT